VGFVAPAGCAIGPEGRPYPSRESVEGFFLGPGDDCHGGAIEASCGTPSDDCPPDACAANCEPCACRPPRKKFWHHLPKCHLYEPEAGIFNFCIPPQCINPPSPLPPGRFFPVPVQPAFAQRADSGYGLLMGGDASGGGIAPPVAPCP
jgi:hypothetical protein